MSRRADQLLAGFAEGDAISQDALLLQAVFLGLGLQSEIFVPEQFTEPAGLNRVRPLSTYRGAPGDVVVLHDALAPEVHAVFRASPATKVLRYHNITPAHFFAPYDGALAARLTEARAALETVARQAAAAWSDSAFNAGELAGWGLPRNRVLPLLFSEAGTEPVPDPTVAARYGGGLSNILFVGRLVPNKGIEDLILAFHWFHKAVDPRSRLVIAGSERSCPRYAAMLRLLAHALDLPNVCFEGFVSPAGLAALYRSATLFMSASLHEGYCLPLVEAMAHGVPVIARECGGMPEALGGGGLLYEDLSASCLGELMAEAIHNPVVRQAMLDSQADRMTMIRAREPDVEVKALLAELD
jgi:glycosyltransferase involved in cell wall biosynthesis